MPDLRTRRPTQPPAPRTADRGSGQDPDATGTQERFHRRRRARRWRAVRRVLAVALVLALVAAALWAVFFSSWLSVRKVDVTGNRLLTDAAVERAAHVPYGDPLATADLDAVRARVEDLPQVRSADVSRGWPGTVDIKVTERVAVAAVAWEGRWRGLDSTGVVFREWPKKPAGLPAVAVRAGTSADALAETAKVIQALPSALLGRVRTFDVGSVDAIDLHLRNGVVVHWGSADQSAAKVAVLQALMHRHAREYDVTAPGRPTIRP